MSHEKEIYFSDTMHFDAFGRLRTAEVTSENDNLPQDSK